jgi:hypothetical protein
MFLALQLACVFSQTAGGGQPSLFPHSSLSSMPTGYQSSIPNTCRVEAHPGANTYVTLTCPNNVSFLDISHADHWSYESKSDFQDRKFLFAVECS